MIIKLQSPPLQLSKKSSELCLSSFSPQKKVAYLISKEHFKLSRVALFTHCSFSQACPFKASNIVGFFHLFLFLFSYPSLWLRLFWHSSTCGPVPSLSSVRAVDNKAPPIKANRFPRFTLWYCFFLATKFPVVWETGASILHSVTHLQSHLCCSKSLLRHIFKIFGFCRKKKKKTTLHT